MGWATLAPLPHRILVTLTVASALTGCGNGGSGGAAAPAVAPAGSHTLEAAPFAKLGSGKFTFYRSDMTGPGWREGIYRIDAAAATSAFAFAGGNTWYVDDPQSSPDGSRIAFTRWTDVDTLFNVYVANADGSGLTQVSAFAEQEGPVAWTADGTQVLYTGYTLTGQDGNWNLYRQLPLPVGTTPIVQVTNFSNTSGCPTFDFNNDRVSAATTGALVWACPPHIELTSADGSSTNAIYTLPSLAPLYAELHAATWSPDAQRIAFLVLTRTAQDGPRQQVIIKTVDAQGQGETTVATVSSSGQEDIGGENDIYSLCWSPDGSHIVFDVPDGDAQAHLWVVQADGTGLAQVTSAPGVWDHSVSCTR